MPGLSTVYRWLASNDSFRELYTRAREDQADTLADEIVAIADEPMVGKKQTTKANGDVEIVEGDMIEHRRLRVDARKWTASKLKPRKYGEKLELAGDKENPLYVERVERRIVDPAKA